MLFDSRRWKFQAVVQFRLEKLGGVVVLTSCHKVASIKLYHYPETLVVESLASRCAPGPDFVTNRMKFESNRISTRANMSKAILLTSLANSVIACEHE